MYYFSELKDIDIAGLLNLSRSAIQYKRTKGLKLLKKYYKVSSTYVQKILYKNVQLF